MSKVVTVRLSEDEYKKISDCATAEHRPISNFIAAKVLEEIEESSYVDSVEMAQINSDRRLTQKLRRGHSDASKMKGKFVG